MLFADSAEAYSKVLAIEAKVMRGYCRLVFGSSTCQTSRGNYPRKVETQFVLLCTTQCRPLLWGRDRDMLIFKDAALVLNKCDFSGMGQLKNSKIGIASENLNSGSATLVNLVVINLLTTNFNQKNDKNKSQPLQSKQ